MTSVTFRSTLCGLHHAKSCMSAGVDREFLAATEVERAGLTVGLDEVDVVDVHDHIEVAALQIHKMRHLFLPVYPGSLAHG
jgi:hypothetical protein